MLTCAGLCPGWSHRFYRLVSTAHFSLRVPQGRSLAEVSNYPPSKTVRSSGDTNHSGYGGPQVLAVNGWRTMIREHQSGGVLTLPSSHLRRLWLHEAAAPTLLVIKTCDKIIIVLQHPLLLLLMRHTVTEDHVK